VTAESSAELSAGGIPLLVPRVGDPPGTRLRVRIGAHDVMLATEEPRGVSALNVLPARIREIRLGDGPGALVRLQAGPNRLLARITRRSAEALALAPGQSVYAVIKAVSVAKHSITRHGGSGGSHTPE